MGAVVVPAMEHMGMAVPAARMIVAALAEIMDLEKTVAA